MLDDEIDAEDWDDDWDEYDPFDDPNHDLWPIRWTADGCETLEEAAGAFEALASQLRAMKVEGWELDQPVDNGHLSMRKNP